MHCTPVLILVLLASLHATAAERGVNLIPNPGFENDDAWLLMNPAGSTLDSTVAHAGNRSLRLEGSSLDDTQGAMTHIELDPPLQHSFTVSAWSRSENAQVEQDYNVYLDLHYADGTPLWGMKTEFQPGTHDWTHGACTFNAAKPVKSIEVFVLFRKAKGVVWFDDIEVMPTPFQLNGIRVMPALFGAGLGVSASANLPCSWRVTAETPNGILAEESGDQLPIRFLSATALPREYTLRIAATDAQQNETIAHEQPVRLPESPSANPPNYAVWTETSMTRIMPNSLPEESGTKSNAAISLACNEYESFQIALLPAPEHDLSEVQIETTDLENAEKGARIAKENIAWFQEGYVKLGHIQPHPAATDNAPGWWPDALLPVSHFNVPAGFAQAIWVTVYAPPDTPAGRYEGTFTIRPKNEAPTNVHVQADVYGFTLPVQSHLKTAFALMDGFLERTYGTPLDPALRQAYGDFVLQHRLNPDDISRTAPPAIEDLLHYRDRSLNAFNVRNMVEERGTNPWVCWSTESVYTETFKQQLIQQLDPYVETLRQHGLADTAYIYTFDERGKEFYPIMREYFGMVKERYPEIHTLTTAYIEQNPETMRDLNVDWACPLTAAYRCDQAQKCRAEGFQVWAYICMGPGYPYANWLLNHPLVEARVIWWQAFQQKMDGFLYWGLNIWDLPHNAQAIDPANGPMLDWSITTGGEYDWLHGDGRLLYAGKQGPIGSIRLANIRDGLEDYEYLYMVGEGTQPCNPVTQNLTHFTRDPKVVYGQREVIAQRIENKR